MTRLITASVLSVMVLGGCVVHHRHHRNGPPPPRATVTVRTPPPPPRARRRPPPPPPPRHVHSNAPHQVRVEAPPANRPAPVVLSVRATPNRVRRGNEVVLHVNPPQPDVSVYFMGRPLPKKTQAGGAILKVRVPSSASSGFFEVVWRGQRFRSNNVVVTD